MATNRINASRVTGTVRPAVAQDAPEIVRLGGLMYDAVGKPPNAEWARYALRIVEKRLSEPGENAELFGVVVEAPDGSLAACGLVNVEPRLPKPGARWGHVAYVQWVSTDPKHQRQGYARAIMDALLEECNARGIEVVELHASDQGRPLYSELGFEVNTRNIAMAVVRPRRGTD